MKRNYAALCFCVVAPLLLPVVSISKSPQSVCYYLYVGLTVKL